MQKNNKLAIIVPAYKSDFLAETLESIRRQTDTDYHLYVFNDASTDRRIEPIVRSFAWPSEVTYLCFDANVGSRSLPAQWNRCISRIDDERWIWLFSDDDVMDPDCLENFRKTLRVNPDQHLFRFNTIKFQDDILLRRNEIPSRISLPDWLAGKWEYRWESYAVEHIFTRSLYKRLGGFPDFPLGWCADDWFWIQAIRHTTLITVPDSWVYWRYSHRNISGTENDPHTASLKLTACSQFSQRIETLAIFRNDPKTRLRFQHWLKAQWDYLSP